MKKLAVSTVIALMAITAHCQIIRGAVTTSSDGRQLITNNFSGMRILLNSTNGSVIIVSNGVTVTAGTNTIVTSQGGTNFTISAVVSREFVTNVVTGIANTNGSFASPHLVISLTAPANNDTNWFGPWTTGTKTAGIQEALNALPRAASSSASGGGLIEFRPGTFFTATNISVPCNSNAYSVTFFGAGPSACGIVYTNITPMDVLTIGAPHSHSTTILNMQNMFFASNTNACTNIIHIAGQSANPPDSDVGGIARVKIDFCWIGYWRSMTNNSCGGFTPSSCSDAIKHNLVGIWAEGNYSDLIDISDCSFNYVNAIYWANDHGTIQNNMFEHCGRTPGGPNNDWPTSSPLYIGAAVTCAEPIFGASPNGNKHWTIRNSSFVGCDVQYYAGPSFASYAVSYDDQSESGEVAVVTPGTRWLIVNPRSSAGYPPTVNYYATNTANFSTWKNNLAPTNMVQMVDLRSNLFNGPMQVPNLGIGTNASLWGLELAKAGFRQARVTSVDDDAFWLIGSRVTGSTNFFIAATFQSSGLPGNRLVFGRCDQDASVGSAVTLFSIIPSTGAGVFVGPVTASAFAGDGSAVTSVNASSLSGIGTNQLVVASTNADLSLTFQEKFNLTNSPALTGFFLRTNGLPSAADVGGAAYFWNSNGTVYVVPSSPGSTTLGTPVKLAP